MLQVIYRKARRVLGMDRPGGRVQVRCARRRIGTRYGGCTICPQGLNSASVVYSVGIGEDVSFDLALIDAFGCTVRGFDPTPRSIAWVRSRGLAAQFQFHDFGLSDHDGTLALHLPRDPTHVSGSLVNRPGTEVTTIEVPVRRLKTAMDTLGHTRLDLLKLDIEGAEYEVVDDILSSWTEPIPIQQLLIEFHYRFFPDGLDRTRRTIAALNGRGFRIFDISRNGNQYSFIQG
jgi:FkbM family methyltransferase